MPAKGKKRKKEEDEDTPPTKKAKIVSRWQWHDPDANVWKDYDPATCEQLDAAPEGSKVPLTAGYFATHPGYEVDLGFMLQTNTSTDFARSVRKYDPKYEVPWWEWEGDDGWESYDGATAAILEGAFQAGKESSTFEKGGTEYLVNLKTMQQTNPKTGGSRPIRRRNKEKQKESASAAKKTASSDGAPPASGVWEWKNGATWKRFDDKTAGKLEAAWEAWKATPTPSKAVTDLDTGFFADHPGYTVDFAKMQQENVATGAVRDVRRKDGGEKAMAKKKDKKEEGEMAAAGMMYVPGGGYGAPTATVTMPGEKAPSSLAEMEEKLSPVKKKKGGKAAAGTGKVADGAFPATAWSWLDEDAGKWVEYDGATVVALEKAWENKLTSIDLSTGIFAKKEGYKVDLEKMVQVNTETGYSRPVRRTELVPWEWHDDESDKWTTYDAENARDIEEAFQAKKEKVALDKGVFASKNGYEVLFGDMVQVNTKTGMKRAVKRDAPLKLKVPAKVASAHWEFRDDEAEEKWKAYDAASSAALEKAWQLKKGKCKMVDGFFAEHDGYEVDLKKMVQTNTKTGYSRPVRRMSA